jgi:hypothetical protein
VVGFIEAVGPPHVESVLHWIGLHAFLFAVFVLPHHAIHPNFNVLQWDFGSLTDVLLFSFELLVSY